MLIVRHFSSTVKSLGTFDTLSYISRQIHGFERAVFNFTTNLGLRPQMTSI